MEPFAPKNVKIKCKTFIKGDEKITCIAAASIVAKATRDLFMIKTYLKNTQNTVGIKILVMEQKIICNGLKKYGINKTS